MRPQTALCFIVWNERHGCEFDLPQFDFTGFDEVFAIDGGSNDGTVEILQKYGVTVHRQVTRSLNAAYWQAVETTACDNLVVFFPKGTLGTSVPAQTRDILAKGYDLVIPSRMIKGSQNEEDGHFFRPRKWGIKVLALTAALCWRRQGGIIWDVLHGVKGFSRQAFLAMNPSRVGVSIDLEMVVRAYRVRLLACEFPIQEISRPWGETRFKILPTGIKLARFLWHELRRPVPLKQFSKPESPAERISVPTVDG